MKNIARTPLFDLYHLKDVMRYQSVGPKKINVPKPNKFDTS